MQLIRARFRQRSVGCAARPRTVPLQIYGVETLWFWAETLTVFVQMFAGCVTAIDLWRYRSSFHWGAASPFEVEVYLLLGLPRSLGGEGFCSIELNVEVTLSASARSIVGKSRVYIDLLLSSPDGRRQVAIECQGKASHGRAGDGLRDADRMTALQAMGYDVLLLTHRQISDEDRFRAIVKAVCRMLDAEYRDKSPDEQRAETLLRSELFVDWSKLGVIDGKMPVRHKTARSWTAAVLSE